MTETAKHTPLEAELLATLKLVLKRLGELNRDDEAGIRVVLANAIDRAQGKAGA